MDISPGIPTPLSFYLIYLQPATPPPYTGTTLLGKKKPSAILIGVQLKGQRDFFLMKPSLPLVFPPLPT